MLEQDPGCSLKGRPCGRLRRKQRVDEQDDGSRETETEAAIAVRERNDRLLGEALEDLSEGLSLDGADSREALVRDDSERPCVGGDGDGLGADDLFRGHVVWGAEHDATLGEAGGDAQIGAERLREAKVKQPYLLVLERLSRGAEQEDVLRLHVTMNHTVRVRVRESVSERGEDTASAERGERSFAKDPPVETLADEQGRHERDATFMLDHLDHVCDRRVREGLGHLGFSTKAVGVRAPVLLQDLEGDGLSTGVLARLVDHAHPAFPDHAKQAEPAEQGPRRQIVEVTRAERRGLGREERLVGRYRDDEVVAHLTRLEVSERSLSRGFVEPLPQEVDHRALVQACHWPSMVASSRTKVNDTTVEEQLAEARAAYPSLEVDEPGFLRALASRRVELVAARERKPETGGELHTNDLFLAYACVTGVVGAAELFEKLYGSLLKSALSRFRLGHEGEDEVLQTVRERLFVTGNGARARLSDYSGSGPLSAWLRAVVARVALDTLRRAKRPGDPGRRDADEELRDAAGALGDPELEHLLARYREPFKEAFQAALEALPERERGVLRFSIVDGLNVDAIGALHGVHRATAARWVAQSREALALGTREILAARFRLSRAELDSITRLCRSQVDVSLLRLLGCGTD